MLINFITFKWGTKYNSLYVNRVYWAMKALYTGEFLFHCITDDSTRLDKDIIIHDINEIAPTNDVFCTNRFNTFNKDFKIKGKKICLEGKYRSLNSCRGNLFQGRKKKGASRRKKAI